MMEHETSKMRETLQELYNRRSDQVQVSPSWLATEAMLSLDPERKSPSLVYLAAHLHFRQIARTICASKWERDEDSETDQHELWPELQKRYPVERKKGDEPVYVRLEYLSPKDVAYNVKRLRSEADAKNKHAQALEAWIEKHPMPLIAPDA